jgi:transcriptional regulator with PAS, ATPase and Fis domain
VVPHEVPPLRERIDDIPMLVTYFADKHAARIDKTFDALEEAVIDRLQAHPWPGNVRELENTIERAVVLAAGPSISTDAVVVDTVGRDWPAGVPSLKLRQNVEWIERETIRRALGVSRAKHQAARLMGISPRALSYYLAKYPFIEDGEENC